MKGLFEMELPSILEEDEDENDDVAALVVNGATRFSEVTFTAEEEEGADVPPALALLLLTMPLGIGLMMKLGLGLGLELELSCGSWCICVVGSSSCVVVMCVDIVRLPPIPCVSLPLSRGIIHSLLFYFIFWLIILFYLQTAFLLILTFLQGKLYL